MSDGTKIEWADASWQPQVGCTRTSDPGCQNCYAVSTIHRFRKAEGLTKLRPKGSNRPGLDWSGEVLQQPERLADPLRWKKPRRIFVCSQSDLFHERTPFPYIAAVFGVMAACPQHTFLVLTKRPERAREFFAWVDKREGHGQSMFPDDPPEWRVGQMLSVAARKAGVTVAHANAAWPLPNVHLGVSCSDQATADAAIPDLLECPAAIRWISYEPALGPVDFHAIQIPGERQGLRFSALQRQHDDRFGSSDRVLDTIVIGGESGPRARPFDIAWARDVLRQVAGTGCTAYVKQLGSKPVWLPGDDVTGYEGIYQPLDLTDRKGGDMSQWPVDLRVREWAHG
jgi:protein gp37